MGALSSRAFLRGSDRPPPLSPTTAPLYIGAGVGVAAFGTLVFLTMSGVDSAVVLIALAATALVGLICGVALRRLANRQA
jgi:ABC-type proline/glycine betaine transport system permease subunit